MNSNKHLFELAVKTKKGNVRRFPLPDGSFNIGRNPTCEVYIPDSSISRKHACVTISGRKAFIEDLDSLNGTLVDGEKLLKKTAFELGEIAVLGELEVRLAMVDETGHPPPQAWLEVVNTSLRGKMYHLTTSRILIGRSQTADLQLNHATVSRAHAVIRYLKDESCWMLEDRRSANGSYVDGVMVSQSLLSGDERVRLGDVQMLFLDHRPLPRRRYGLLVALVGLLGVAIALLLLNLFGLLFK